MDANNVLAEEAKTLNRQWMESNVRRDTAFLEQHLSGDLRSGFATILA